MNLENIIFKIHPFETLNYDLIVIGASEGGLSCAQEAANNGASVCVILTCYNNVYENIYETEIFRFLHAGLLMEHYFEAAKYFGYNLEFTVPNDAIEPNKNDFKPKFFWTLQKCDQNEKPKSKGKISWCKFKRKLQYSADIWAQNGVLRLINNRIHYIKPRGEIKFLNKNLIAEYGSRYQMYYGENIVIAPTITRLIDKDFPYIPGAKEFGVLSSKLTDLNDLYGRILIVGDDRRALVIAAALSIAFSNDITLLCQRKSILPHYDQEMLNYFIKICQFEYLPNCLIHSIAPVGEICQSDNIELLVKYTQLSQKWRQTRTFNHVIFTPILNIDLSTLSLEKAQVKLNFRCNKIKTNLQFQTNISNIYCISDDSEIMEKYKLISRHIGTNLSKNILYKTSDKYNSLEKHQYFLITINLIVLKVNLITVLLD